MAASMGAADIADDRYLSGAGRVFALWLALACVVWLVWEATTRVVFARGFLAILFLGVSAAGSPIYGTVVYALALHRKQHRIARAAALTASVLFVFGAGICIFTYWAISALQHLR